MQIQRHNICTNWFVKLMAHAIIRGIILNPFGFYISILPNGLSPLSLIAMRTHLSKIISEGEAGKIFSF